MKTLEQIKQSYRSKTIDGRDIARLGKFIPADQLADFGLKLTKDGEYEPLPFTRENVLEQLRKDVEFGFDKALGRRGISASLMFEVVRMWNWILEEGLEDWDQDRYSMYGLPLFKATAIKYGFPDEIEGYEGTERRFNDDDYYDY